MTPEISPLQGQPWWQQAIATLGAVLMSWILAWRVRGRRDRREPFSPEKGAQPRVITRDEWHAAVQVVNAFPGLSARVKRTEAAIGTLERDFQDHMRISNEQAQDFADFRGRWEE